MKTRYLPVHGDYEGVPEDMPTLNNILIDDDDRTELGIEFATYFTVIAANPGGWRRPGETNYIRTEHLTLTSARKAAKTRYDTDDKKRGCLIYAVTQYVNKPIGTAFVVEGYPPVSNPYSREARAAKRKAGKLPKSVRNMPEPEQIERSERHFEPSTDQLAEIKRKLDEVKVVSKGGSKVAFKYRNRPR